MAVIGIPLRYQKLSDGRPIIYMAESVRRTIQKAGGVVLPIPPVQNIDYFLTRGNEFEELTENEKKTINKYLNSCDGVFIPGGIKFTPYDRYLLECIIDKKIPVLGVCLGMQTMSLYKEKEVVLEEIKTNINHKQEDDDKLSHTVEIKRGSKIYEILGKSKIKVNSFHTRCTSKNDYYKAVAYSEDGIIEAIEYPGDFFNIGVQWHPEISYDFDENSKLLIDYFIKEAEEFAKKRKEKIGEI